MSAASSHLRTQGIARHALLIVVLLIAASAAGIYWKIRYRADVDEPAMPTVSTSGPIVREGAGIEELLQHARQAMAEQRLLAPAGNNAFEFYLAVLKREPGNRVAQDALREIFPFAAHAAEQIIDEGDDAEAQRQVELLAKADPQNYTLTLLQSKLQARRDAAAETARTASRHEAPATAPARTTGPAQVAAAVPAPAEPRSGAAALTTPGEQATTPQHVASTPVDAASRNVVRPPIPPGTPADAAASAPPMLTRRIEPAYPAEARRTRRQGWVDVTFTVQPDGSVTGAAVADADPKYVFDRAALTAVSRWQFSPGMRDGKAVASQVRQRIEFRL